jgi:predicted transposase/invertase (TIGR01784 family)
MTFVKYKHLLKRLVAGVLKIDVNDIQEFDILNSEILPEALNKKLCRLDIHLKVNGEYVDVEMQMKDKGNFAERLLGYWSKAFAGALAAGRNCLGAPRTALIGFAVVEMFDCKEYCSEFMAMERHRHEILTNKMSIFVFELGKLPERIDRGNILELFLRLFRADTEEEMEYLENLEVVEMKEMVKAYRETVNSPDYADLERKRLMNRLDEGQALHHAVEVAHKEWEAAHVAVIAGKDAALAGKDEVIAGKDAALADKDAALAGKDAVIADKDAVIEKLLASRGKDK